MKEGIAIIILGIILTSCGGSKKTEADANGSSDNAEITSVQNVNTNSQLNLKETVMDKAGLSISLPENWTVDLMADFEGAPSYFVNRNGKEVIVIETFQNESSEETMQTILESFSKNNKIIAMEDLDEKESTKIIGVVNHNINNKPHRQIQFKYLSKFSSGKTKFAKYVPGDAGYNSASVDTCIAIIKSIKPKNKS